MSNYTSGNNAPTLMAQAPNRKGNVSKTLPSHTGGVNGKVRQSLNVAYAEGCQGAPSANGKVNDRNQPVLLSRPACHDGKNSGYMNSDRSNYLK